MKWPILAAVVLLLASALLAGTSTPFPSVPGADVMLRRAPDAPAPERLRLAPARIAEAAAWFAMSWTTGNYEHSNAITFGRVWFVVVTDLPVYRSRRYAAWNSTARRWSAAKCDLTPTARGCG